MTFCLMSQTKILPWKQCKFKILSMKKISRRNFFKTPLLFSFFPLASKGKILEGEKKIDTNEKFSAANFNPLSSMGDITTFSSTVFAGEDVDRPHEILWDLNGYITKQGGVPPVSKHYDVVIVGGGISGLTAAYYLKDKKVLILEDQERLGGNAKGEVWQGSPYSQGAAYIGIVEDGTPSKKFFEEIGLNFEKGREEISDEMKVYYKGKFASGLFSGNLSPEESEEMKSVVQYLAKVYEENYPDMPYVSGGMARTTFNKLDQISLLKWFEENIPKRPILFDEFITQYCWSSFNADWDEISAAQGLNFILSDLQKTIAFPGGNAFISQTIFNSLMSAICPPEIRSKCFVCKISDKNGKAIITFDNHLRKLESVSADYCIVATQKKFSKHIIENLSKEQEYAMDRIMYRSYLVGNLLLKKKIPSAGYDVFSLKGKIPDSARRDLEDRYATDLIFANWASHDQDDKSILTFYIPRSYQGAEQYLLSPYAHEKYYNKLMELLPLILESIDLNINDVEGIRMTRWGHAMPIAKVGLIASGYLEKAQASINNRIFFANQDNWANPCFETAFNSALDVSLRIREFMNK